MRDGKGTAAFARAAGSLRYPDGQAWSGGAEFAFVREPCILGQ